MRLAARHLLLVACLLCIPSMTAGTPPPCHVYVVSDPHLDLNYRALRPQRCLFGDVGFRCCRDYDIALRGSRPASEWGSYKCDSPERLLHYALMQAQQLFRRWPPCAVVVLGDMVDHSDLRQSFRGNMKSVGVMTRLVERAFPGVPLVPVIGNHDSWFVDQALPPRSMAQQSALHRKLLALWALHIPPSQHQLFGYGGYYAVEVGAVRFLVLNSLWGDANNIFLWFGARDPARMMAWVELELKQARATGTPVILVNHISPLSTAATGEHRARMLALLHEYRDVVRSTWHGHTHEDEVQVFNVTDPVGYVVPSLMPDGHDPALRIMTLQAGELMEYTQWTLSLRDLVRRQQSNWTQLYSTATMDGLDGV